MIRPAAAALLPFCPPITPRGIATNGAVSSSCANASTSPLITAGGIATTWWVRAPMRGASPC